MRAARQEEQAAAGSAVARRAPANLLPQRGRQQHGPGASTCISACCGSLWQADAAGMQEDDTDGGAQRCQRRVRVRCWPPCCTAWQQCKCALWRGLCQGPGVGAGGAGWLKMLAVVSAVSAEPAGSARTAQLVAAGWSVQGCCPRAGCTQVATKSAGLHPAVCVV